MTTSGGDATEPGSRIRELRLARHMTQKDLAGDAYSVSYISAIERGRVEMPSRAILEWCARQLRVALPEITGESVVESAEGRWMQRKLSQHAYEQVYAQLLVGTGEMGRARELLRKLRREKSAPHEGLLLWYTALSAYLAGDLDEAVALAETSLRMAGEQQDVHGTTRAHWLLGRIALARGEVGRADRELSRALDEEAKTLVSPDAALPLRVARADVLRALGEHAQAHEIEMAALREYELFANPVERTRRAREQAEKAASRGDDVHAYLFIRWAWQSLREVNAHREAAALYLRHATFASEHLTPERREAELRRALELAELVGDADTGRLAAAYLAESLAETPEKHDRAALAEEMMRRAAGGVPAEAERASAGEELAAALALARGWMALARDDKDAARRHAADVDALLASRSDFQHTDARYAEVALARLFERLDDAGHAFAALKRAMELR